MLPFILQPFLHTNFRNDFYLVRSGFQASNSNERYFLREQWLVTGKVLYGFLMPLPSEVKGKSGYSGLQSPNVCLLSLLDNLNVPSSHCRVIFSISTCLDPCCSVFLAA